MMPSPGWGDAVLDSFGSIQPLRVTEMSGLLLLALGLFDFSFSIRFVIPLTPFLDVKDRRA